MPARRGRDAGLRPDLGAPGPTLPPPVKTSGNRRPGQPCPILRRLRHGQPAPDAGGLRRRSACSPLRPHHADGPCPRTRAREALSRLRHRAARQRPPDPGNSRQGHPVPVAQRPRKTAPPCASRARLCLSRPARAVGWRKRWAHAPFGLVFFPASKGGESREKNLVICVERRVTRRRESRLVVGDFVTWLGVSPTTAEEVCYGFDE